MHMFIIIASDYNTFYYNFWLHEIHKVIQNCSLTILFSIASSYKKIYINFCIAFD